MNQWSLRVVSVLAAAMSFGATALAQTTGQPGAADDTAAPPPAPPSPAPPPAPGPVTTSNNDAVTRRNHSPRRRSAFGPVTTSNNDAVTGPAPTIPMAEDKRAEVVQHTWPNRPLLITGLVLLGGTYGASVIVGAASNREADDRLFIPVVGPWLDLKDRNCDVNACRHEGLNKTLLIGSGALQGVGALGVLLSLVIPESHEKPWYLIGDRKLSVGPQVGMSNAGLTAFGHF